MAKVSYYLYNYISKRNNVLYVKNSDLFNKRELVTVRCFKPDIIHHIPGPSFKGLSFALMLKKFLGSNLVISATRPELPFFPSKLLTSVSKPDLVLVQAFESEALFRALGCKTYFLPNGVDLQKFSPVDLPFKNKIRRKYGFLPEDFIILHVGPIKQGRNMKTLAKLAQDKRVKVVIVGSTTTPLERSTYNDLVNSGCLVWHKYFERIEELYWAANVYVFPTFELLNCIETPLSVLEAMSTNLPVVTTKYGALPRMFAEGDGLFFAEDESELITKIKEAENLENIQTRKKVAPYSWEKICETLESLYHELLLTECHL